MSCRRRLLVLPLLVFGVLAAPATAHAHPLGNLTINTSASLVLRADEVVVDYVVDMAEIPALQGARDDRCRRRWLALLRRERRTLDNTCEGLRAGLRMDVDGTVPRLAVRSSELSQPEGQTGLPTLRFTCVFHTNVAADAAHHLVFEDSNYADRLGWREVTAAGDGATIVRSDVPAESLSHRLRSHPKDVRPSDVRSASLTFRPGGASPPAQPASAAAEPHERWVARRPRLSSRSLSAGLVALMIGAAIGVGAVHALGPGHGKSLVGAYLVGSAGTLRQAIAVGAAVSVMHTASVLGLGLLVLSAERVFAPDRVYPWLGLASCLVALGLGAALLVTRLHALSERRRH